MMQGQHVYIRQDGLWNVYQQLPLSNYHQKFIRHLNYLNDQHINDSGVTDVRILEKLLSQLLTTFLHRYVQLVEFNGVGNLYKE